MSKAANDVLAERQRQKDVCGWTADHDDEHLSGEMAKAASCYAINNILKWPWDLHHWKPKSYRENLVRAGALIIAEIERLDRLETSNDH